MVINGHNKNILNQQEKPSPCNCRDKTSCPLKESCQHKNLVYSCKVSAADLKQNHSHYIDLQNIHTSTNITILLTTSQRETQKNFLISYGVKRKGRLMWILIHAASFQIRKNFSLLLKTNSMLCVTEKYHIISSTKNLLKKSNELVNKYWI